MTSPHSNNPGPPGEPSSDIAFTRLAQAALSRVEVFAINLARRFQAVGLCSDIQVMQTPRGLSTFLALVGQRGLLCIIDMTMVDGMAVGQGRRVALDIRLIDACGDLVADAAACSLPGDSINDLLAAKSLVSETLDRAATSVYLTTLAHFDVLRPTGQTA